MFFPAHVCFWRIEYVVQQIARARLGKAGDCKFDERDVFLVIDGMMDVPKSSLLMPTSNHSRSSQSHCRHGKETDRSPRTSSGTRRGVHFHWDLCSLFLLAGGRQVRDGSGKVKANVARLKIVSSESIARAKRS